MHMTTRSTKLEYSVKILIYYAEYDFDYINFVIPINLMMIL